MTGLAEIDLILASSSPYRRELLARIAADFRCIVPDIDETALECELPRDLAIRLAQEKAENVARANPGAVVIGSDQVACIEGSADPLGKPGSVARARAQLAAFSGRCVCFHSAVCLIDARRPSNTGHVPARTASSTTKVYFRQIDAGSIDRYIEREQPLDCAGSFKCEGLGIALFERIEADDPTALVGLPLISLCALLRHSGIEPI